jgi:hypothetical protein
MWVEGIVFSMFLLHCGRKNLMKKTLAAIQYQKIKEIVC